MKQKIEAYVKKYGSSIWLRGRSLFVRGIASNFVRKVAETFATRLLLIGISLITSVMVARILGPDGRGLYALATTIAAIGVQFGNLGLHASNTYFVAKDRKLLPTLVGNTLAVSFGFGGLGATLAWAMFSLLPNLAPVHGLILVLALVWIPFGLAYMLLQNLLLGIHEISAYNRIELSTNSFTTLLIGLVFIIKVVTVETVFSAALIGVIISFIWALWQLKKYFYHPPLPSLELFKDNIRYGLKAYTASFLAFMVLKVDLLMINYYCGAEQAGLYSIAVALGNMIYLLPTVVGSILFPKLCAITDGREKLKFVKTVSLSMSCIMLPCIGGAFMMANLSITILFGKAYAAAADAFVWLLPGIFIWSIESIFRKLLTSDGFRSEVIYAWLAALIVNITLNLFLIPHIGTKGAAIASSISFALVAGFTAFSISQDIKNQYG
jgi:O-antigen/teichoic acid export membrane protein